MIVATWTGIGLLVILNIVGWAISYLRYSRNEARHLGRIEGKMDGLNERMESLEKRLEERIGNLEERLNTFMTKYS